MVQPPRLFKVLRDYFGLDEAQARRWWLALCRSHWSVPQAWRGELQRFQFRPSWEQTPEGVDRYLRREMPPRLVVQVIETLICERQLSRTQGSILGFQAQRALNLR